MDALRILGGLLGNRAQSGSIGGQILGQVLGGGGPRPGGPAVNLPQTDPLGGLMRDAFGRRPNMNQVPQGYQPHPHAAHRHHHDHYGQSELDGRAVLLIRAMINAAKADGAIDQREQDNIVKQLGQLSPDEVQFLRQEFAAPLDLPGYVRQVPRGFEDEVYSVSLMAINVDTHSEAHYLRDLAQALNLQGPQCNALHQRYGYPTVF